MNVPAKKHEVWIFRGTTYVNVPYEGQSIGSLLGLIA
jgi:hypothetical protein